MFYQFTLFGILAIFSFTVASDVGNATLSEGDANQELPKVPGQEPCENVQPLAELTDFRSDFCQNVIDNKCQAPADGKVRLTQVSFKTASYGFYPVDETSFRVDIISSDGNVTTIFNQPIINGRISKPGTHYVVNELSDLNPAAKGQRDATVQMSVYDSKNDKNAVVCVQALFDAV